MQGLEIPPAHVRQWTLANGLELLVLEDPGSGVASLQAWCRVGSIHEDRWMGAGLSHILEHMVFKGTTHRRGPEIAAQVQDAGGYINAYTTFDHTVYWIDVPSEGWETCLDVLADIVFHATIPEEEYAREQEVIRREFAMGFDDPVRMTSQLVFETAYGMAPCRHPIIGHLEVFDQLTRQDVLEYYRKHYIPNNVFFVAAGDIEAEEVRACLEERTRSIPRRALRPVYISREPEALGRRDAHIEFATNLTRSRLVWPIPEATHPDVAALIVLGSILGGGRSSRLYRRLREELSWVHSIGASTYTQSREGFFCVYGIMDPEHREETEREVLRMIEEVKEAGVAEMEMEKARKNALSTVLSGLSTAQGRASDLGSNWLLARSPHLTELMFAQLNEATAAEVQRVARLYLREARLVSVSLNPKGSLKASSGSGRRGGREETLRFPLENGGVLLVGRDTRLPLISVQAAFRAGLFADVEGRAGLTRLTAASLLKGTSGRSAGEIADEIESMGGTLTAEGGNNSLIAGLFLLPPDFQKGMEVLGDVLVSAAFPDAEVERERKVQIAGIRAEEDDPLAVACRALRKELFAGHPYAVQRSGTVESVAALSRDDLLSFRETYLTAGNFVLGVYGDVDPEAARAAAERISGALPPGKRVFEDAPVPSFSAGPRVVEIEVDKSQAIIVAGFPGVSVHDPDRLAAELIEEACSDMASRLFLRIREEQGLAYFVSASQFSGLAGGMFYFYLGTSPRQAKEAEEILWKELESLRRGGLTKQELERARRTYLGKLRLQLQSIRSLARMQVLDDLYDLGYDYYRQTEERVQALSRLEVRRAAKRLLCEDFSVRVRALPKGGV